MLPGLRTSVEYRLGAKDPRYKPYLEHLDAMTPPSADLDPQYLRQIEEDVRAIADVAHFKLRAFRNCLFRVGAILACATAVPILAAWSNPAFVPVCASPGDLKVSDTTTTTSTSTTTTATRRASSSATKATSPSAKKSATAATTSTCPTGGTESTKGDVAVIELFGALGGLLTVVASVKRMRPSTAPYVLLGAQTLLKVGVGALTGLFGVMIMQSGLISSLAAQPGGAVFVYAVVFGIAQDSVTRYADRKGSELLDGTESKDTPASDGSTKPSGGGTATTTK